MLSLFCLLFHDALSQLAYVFLFVSMHLEAELRTQEEILLHEDNLTQYGMSPQEETTPDETAE
jgi:hypothetical protein